MGKDQHLWDLNHTLSESQANDYPLHQRACDVLCLIIWSCLLFLSVRKGEEKQRLWDSKQKLSDVQTFPGQGPIKGDLTQQRSHAVLKMLVWISTVSVQR